MKGLFASNRRQQHQQISKSIFHQVPIWKPKERAGVANGAAACPGVHKQPITRHRVYIEHMRLFRSCPLRVRTKAMFNSPRFSSALSPARPKASLQIELTPTEDNLCTLLDDCTRHLRENYPDLPPVECRIAGGWVRDKVSVGCFALWPF